MGPFLLLSCEALATFSDGLNQLRGDCSKGENNFPSYFQRFAILILVVLTRRIKVDLQGKMLLVRVSEGYLFHEPTHVWSDIVRVAEQTAALGLASQILQICKQSSCTGHQWFPETVPMDCKILDVRLAPWINPEGNPVGLEIKHSCVKASPKSEMHLSTNATQYCLREICKPSSASEPRLRLLEAEPNVQREPTSQLGV
ncbi:hypothetical protein llap_4780 [Limosa lapponica baueri]|uniref:Uncharacterized protein n=1 Tax=Limosa lapponica baueri TaxID=1758121 RepID=A0A2I0UFU6_LIMLA|nr:hypothetical protein llap_4780 [Limosa lapponica baueri]